MNIQVMWDDPQKRVLRYEFSTIWDWGDLFAAQTLAWEMLDSVEHDVGVIMHGAEGMKLPNMSLTHGRTAFSKLHPHTCCVVIVAQDSFTRMILSMLKTVSSRASQMLQVASSLDEAHGLLDERFGRSGDGL